MNDTTAPSLAEVIAEMGREIDRLRADMDRPMLARNEEN